MKNTRATRTFTLSTLDAVVLDRLAREADRTGKARGAHLAGVVRKHFADQRFLAGLGRAMGRHAAGDGRGPR